MKEEPSIQDTVALMIVYMLVIIFIIATGGR